VATSTTKNGAPIDAAFSQVREASEQFLAAARKAGNLYLDSYESAVERTVELERKFASYSQQEWLRNLIDTQADLTHEFASSYTAAARTLLK
jgi:hypothetical protein